MKSDNNSKLKVLAIFTVLLPILLVPLCLRAEELQGTVVDVQGKTITVKTEIIEGVQPAVGDTVEVIVSSQDGSIKMPAGTWVIKEVNGVFITADPTDRVYQPAEKGMEAVVMISRGKDYRSGPDVFVPGDKTSTPRGKVTMMRGNNVTIVLDLAASSVMPEQGDKLELQFTVAGEPFVVGTWQVTVVKDTKTVEAEPVKVIKPPSIGYQAVFLPKEKKVVSVKISPQPKQEKKTEAEIKEPAAPRQVEKRREIDVTQNFSGMDEKTSCQIGTVRVRNNRIEMDAKKGEPDLHCFYPVSGETLENFRASVELQVEGKNFLVGLVFGDITNSSSDRLVAYLATMTIASSSGKWWKRDTNESWSAWLGESNLTKDNKSSKGWMEDLWSAGNVGSQNPTPGILEFVKNGKGCSLSWNGEKFFSWEETNISKGKIGIMFKPISDRRGTAVFSNISVKRLD